MSKTVLHVKVNSILVLAIGFLLLLSLKMNGQTLALFDNTENIELVKKGGNYIYNMQPDSAKLIIEQVKNILPNHPIVPMMEALNIAWHEMPLQTTSLVYDDFVSALNRVIETSLKLQDDIENHPEGVFFEMSARGLKAEIFAKEGSYLKALGEAKRMYSLIKIGFDLVERHSEFMFMTGLYNYFREKYPQRHPIYKPFVWFFKSGDIEKGLQQMDKATQVGILTKIEAHLYVSYVYLRYENNTKSAKKYLVNLVAEYPDNSYFKSKLIECYIIRNEYDEALPHIEALKINHDDYYKMSGEVFFGVYLEKEEKAFGNALLYYQKALNTGEKYPLKGLYFKSLAYLGLGNIYAAKGEKNTAMEYYQKALDINESDVVSLDAKQKIKSLNK